MTEVARESSGTDHRALVAVLALAFALRLIAAFVLPDQSHLLGDAHSYRHLGEKLWQTGHYSDPYRMPLYPILLGLVGPSWGQLLLDISLSTATVWLVYALALSVFRRNSIAILAALITACYPPLIFFSVVGLTETLFIMLVIAAFAAWYTGRFTVAAMSAVLSILTRPTFDLVAPVLVVLFAFVIHRLGIRKSLLQLAVYILVYCALMAPWWVHNYDVYGSFVRLDLNFGLNLYAGNNPMNRSGGLLQGIDYDLKPFEGIKDPVLRDRAMRDAAVVFITEHPRRFIALAGLKLARMMQPWPHNEGYLRPAYIVTSLLTYGPVLLLSLLYLALWGGRDFYRIFPILLFITYYLVVHAVIGGTIRYRLPLEPFMIIFSAAAIVRLAGRWPATAPLVRRVDGMDDGLCS